jgi:hypothetical protein
MKKLIILACICIGCAAPIKKHRVKDPDPMAAFRQQTGEGSRNPSLIGREPGYSWQATSNKKEPKKRMIPQDYALKKRNPKKRSLFESE